MYYFYHCILSKIILFVTSIIDMSFFTSFANAIFGFPLHVFHSLNLNKFSLTGAIIAHL